MSRNGLPSPWLPSPRNGIWYSSPSSSTGSSRRSARRITSTYSRVRASGRFDGWPYQPSTTCGPDTPRPRIIRPPERWSSVDAAIAVAVGVRAAICAIPVPILIVDVCAASQVEYTNASLPHVSATHTESKPSRSAARFFDHAVARPLPPIPEVESELHPRDDRAMRKIEYAGSVHDEAEIAAVLEVLRGPPTALRIGRKVRELEAGVAALFGKQRGVMCNSGSSALYLAVELLNCEPGDEVIVPAVVFSTDVAPLVRAGLVPAFVDVEPDTFNMDVDAIEAMITPRTKAILGVNLIGNAPDWDRIRAIADAHGLKVVEDSCDALGATLHGTPTGTRADISLTSFALSHIITAAGTGGMVLLDDPELVDQCVLLRRWGRRSEVQLYGSKKGDKRFFSDVDGLEYDNLFIFDEVGWNFEPSELSAAFGIEQLRKLPIFLARRQRNFTLLSEHFARIPMCSSCPASSRASRPGGTCSRSSSAPSRGCGAPTCRSTWRRTASTRAWCGRATCCANPRSRRSSTAPRPAGTPMPIG